MNPARLDVLGVAALLTAPALWSAATDGGTSVEDALVRYLLAFAVCAVARTLLRAIVGSPRDASTPRRRRADVPGVD